MADDFGACVRAARGFAGFSRRELAEKLSAANPAAPVSDTTIKRLEGGDPSVKGARDVWAERIATTCNVPLWFLMEGWAGGEYEAFRLSIPKTPAGLDMLAEVFRQISGLPADAPLNVTLDPERNIALLGQPTEADLSLAQTLAQAAQGVVQAAEPAPEESEPKQPARGRRGQAQGDADA